MYDNPAGNIKLGSNLLLHFFETYVATDPALIPNGYEMMHYPFIFAGFLALFFTALNLLPIGQLDGGHILFSVVGWKGHTIISPLLFCGFIFYSGLGTPSPIDFQYDPYLTDKLWDNLFLLALIYVAVSRITPDGLNNFIIALGLFGLQYCLKVWFPLWIGYSGWTFFGIVVGRFLGIYHPPVEDNRPLSKGRIAIAIFSLVVFVLCFSPAPFGQ